MINTAVFAHTVNGPGVRHDPALLQTGPARGKLGHWLKVSGSEGVMAGLG